MEDDDLDLNKIQQEFVLNNKNQSQSNIIDFDFLENNKDFINFKRMEELSPSRRLKNALAGVILRS